MKYTCIIAAGALALAGAAHAGTETNIEAVIEVDRTAGSSADILRSIEQQAIKACRYEQDSVLANMYDEACARDLIEQTLAQLKSPSLDQAYRDTNRATS